ncbi:MAG TPA: DUF1186 domain-containing protein [Candidatus Ozemobacteraceae bacterium]|nr:DUF1186 domain-containing protein [Candidatus Ozemobacteraceae bacterium]
MQTSVSTLIESLLHAHDRLPEQAIRDLVARRDDAVEPLLELLRKAVTEIETVSGETFMGHIYAAMLLASFRERRTHPLLLESLKTKDEHLLMHVWGGMMLDYMPRLLAMTAGPDLTGLIALADDESHLEIVRELALEALGCLVARGESSREPVVGLIRRLLSRPRSRKEEHFVTMLAMVAADIHPGELMDDIAMQITAGNIDGEYLSLDELRLMAAEPVEKVLQRTRESVTMTFFEDVVAEMSDWDCFNEEQVRRENGERREAMKSFFEPPPDLPEFDENVGHQADEIEDAVISVPGPKARPARGPEAGRNEPCPCGSGKKYKKCCGQGA